MLEDIPITSRELGGIVGNAQGDVPDVRAGEEFVSIYRLHSLLPDVVRLVDLDGDGERPGCRSGATRHAALAAR